MLAYRIDPRHEKRGDAASFIAQIRSLSGVADDLKALTAMLTVRRTVTPIALPGLEDTPQGLNAIYGAREVTIAVFWLTANLPTPMHASVLALRGHEPEWQFQLFVRPRKGVPARA